MPILKDDIEHYRLGLIHHAHTGRRLHRSHTSYPLLAVILLMVGVLLTAMTLQVRAATVTVTAVANGSTPVQAAVILSPEQDDRFTSSSVPVSGICEPGYYIKLYRNEIFSGATLCTDGGTFSIITDLFVGRNDLQARTFNVADNEGPASSIVTVYYDQPITDPEDPGAGPSEPAGPGTPSGPASAPFYLSTEYFFKAAYSGQTIKWDFKVFGGQGPFTAYAAWGDGYSDVLTGVEGDSFTFGHAYKTLKEQREYFSVTFRLIDSRGRTASLQLVAIMNDPNVISGALVRPNDPSPLGTAAGWFSGMLKAVWSAYGFVLLMGLCFWLGEKRGESLMMLRRRRHARTG